MLMKLLAVSSLVFLIFAFAPPSAFLQQKEQKAELRVKLVIADGSPVKLAKVVLRSESRKDLPLKEGKEGVYGINAPAGDYYLVVIKNSTCPEVRGMFEIKPYSKVTFDITIHSCAKKNKMIHPGAKTEILSTTYSLPFREDVIQVRHNRFKVQVKYGERDVAGNRVDYRSARADNTPVGVTLYYNLISIHSDSLIFFTDDETVIASGNVMLGNGETTEKLERVCLRIEGASAGTIDCGSLDVRK